MDELVRRHHSEQRLIARNVVAELAPLWGLLDFHRLQETTGPWLKVVRPVIERGFLTSQYVAAEFAKNLRSARLPAAMPLDFHVPNPLGVFGVPLIPDREAQLRIMVSMKVTGPVYVANLMPMEEAEAMRRGLSKSSGAAVRLALSGGRNILVLIADADQHALGIRRVMDDSSCDSCRSRADFAAKAVGQEAMATVVACHDFGRCSAEIVYDQ